MANQTIDLEKVYTKFCGCLNELNDIELGPFIESYHELCLFFNSLGTVFGFVAKDVINKLKILTVHLNSDNGKEYSTVKSMISYETTNNVIKSDKTNGCRTLLRLHRALDFIALFLENLKQPDSQEKLSDTTYKCYHATLAKHHTWLIRKGVGMAVYTMPTREHLLLEYGQDREQTYRDLDKLQGKLHQVYATVESLYKENDLLNLP